MFNDNIEITPSMSPDEHGSKLDILDNEGAMAKADLYKLANYSFKLFKKLNDEDQLEAWVQAKITKAADYIASVYHYLEYEMAFGKYGEYIENSDVYDTSQKNILQAKLHEARLRIAELKNIQVAKLSSNKTNPLNESVKKDNCTKISPKKKPTLPLPKKVKDEDNKEVIEDTTKPSAGLSKKQKSDVVIKAVAGKNIGKPGKKFTDVVKSAKKSGATDPKAVAAAAMWKGVKKAVVKESFRISNPENKKYNGTRHGEFQTTILNPDFVDYDQGIPEEIDVTVKYSVLGGYSPASMDGPETHEEYDITSITNDETGEEITVPEKTLNKIYDEIENNAKNGGESDYDSDYEPYRSIDEEGEGELSDQLPPDDQTLEDTATGPNVRKIDLGDGVVVAFNSDTNDIPGIYLNGSFIGANELSPEQQEMVNTKLQNYIQQQSEEFSSWFGGIKGQIPQDQIPQDQIPQDQNVDQEPINEMNKILKLAGL